MHNVVGSSQRRMPHVILVAAALCSSLAVGCGGQSSGMNDREATPDASNGIDGAITETCKYLANVETAGDASASGCFAGPSGQICQVSNGASVTVLEDGGSSISGGTESCASLCPSAQYELTCRSYGIADLMGPIPNPDSTLRCTIIPIPTPSNALFYCCPCARGGDTATVDSSTNANDGNSTDSSPGIEADSASCMILASNYDQSCTVDTDCTEVSSGDYCSGDCICGGSTINVGSLANFNEDVSKTPLDSGALGNFSCNCPGEVSPCCLGGKCQPGPQCNSVADASDEAANADALNTNDASSMLDAGTDTAFSPESCPESSNTTTGFNGQSCSQYVLCVLIVDVWCCDCGHDAGGSRNCPSGVGTGASCDPGNSVPCMSCDGVGTTRGGGMTCGCDGPISYEKDSGPQWECLGTGEACQWSQ